jgi:hypothetical protein
VHSLQRCSTVPPRLVRIPSSASIAARVTTDTGPPFVKYNAVLRGAPGKVPFFAKTLRELCQGNLYATTIHVINQALTTLAALSKCQFVYRGVSGGLLPPEFTVEDESDHFKGGVEYAFSTLAWPVAQPTTQQHAWT